MPHILCLKTYWLGRENRPVWGLVHMSCTLSIPHFPDVCSCVQKLEAAPLLESVSAQLRELTAGALIIGHGVHSDLLVSDGLRLSYAG